MITSIVLGILLVASLFFIFLRNNDGVDALPQNKAEARANEFINILSDPQNPLRVSSVEEDNGIYRINIDLQGQTETWYMSLNGDYLAPQAFTLDQIRTIVGGQQPPQEQQPPQTDVNVNLEGANVLGSGDVLMVEYSSATCPFCARYNAETFPLITEQYIETGEITYVYKHFIRNDVDVLAANAMECAGEQGSFFEFKELVYSNQNSLAQTSSYSTWASELDLDVDAFDDCFNERRYSAKATADTGEGQGNGVTGTPGFLVGSRLIAGAQPFASFQTAIDAELAN
jgi:protein-disulfide isomerase